MGNSFIGFPVPRAKIADMIAGAAPPLIHHTDHETGGDDEVDCTGLAGVVAGIGFSDFLFNLHFTSLDAIDQNTGGTGVVGLYDNYVALWTETTLGSYAALYKRPDYNNPVMTWSKERRFSMRIWLRSYTDKYGNVWYNVGDDPGVGAHIGFFVEDGILQGSCGNDSTHTKVTLATLYTGAGAVTKNLEWRFYPGDKVDFLVDGVIEGSITTPSLLPSGTSYAKTLINANIENPGHAKNIATYFSNWKFWQAG